MNLFSPARQSPGLLSLTAGIIVCLTLLINVAFKIISLKGMMLSVNSLICPLTTCLYLLALRIYTPKEQRHLLNISLITLYTFCIGVYVLVNLPAAEYMHGNPVYQIIFDDIPKKFFAVTMAFALSFYLPHLLFCNPKNRFLPSPIQKLFLALLGGASFFLLTFLLLFSGTHVHNFSKVTLDSLIIASLLFFIITLLYLMSLLKYKTAVRTDNREKEAIPFCYYLICEALVITLICSACEYRIIAFISYNGILAASAVFFPISLIISTLIGELWGYRTGIKLSLMLSTTQIIFDMILMSIVALPSPEFFNLNPFYSYIMLRRLPADSLTLFATFTSNTMLLHYLEQKNMQRPLRILFANVCANSLLCLIDYSLLYGGIYPYDQIIKLVVDVWQYKIFMTIFSIPIICKLCTMFEKKNV
ncbi:MAG: VUT family protein [Legionella sp.]|uniref:VUT family protein n=1 Tax=Legionella sp. TaxID=459 RepID=UPI0039E543E7